jgi:short-subunit dehydrogenase
MKKDFFKDRVIVITGATGGVGRVTAWEFAKHGAKIALLAREFHQLNATADEVTQFGGTAMTYMIDVSNPDAIENATEEIETKLGPIDVWINNAMNSVFAEFKDITPAEFKRVTEVTYLGQVYGTMSVLKRMMKRNKGSIILVGSALAFRGIPLQSAYCGAKHGIQGFFDSLRCELLHQKTNVSMSMIQLPAMNTTQFGWVLSKLPNEPRPMGKVYQPEVAAKAILFAAAHKRRTVWVGFPTYKAIIGNKIAPWYADWVLARTGFGGQQTNKRADPDRKTDLWDPVPEDRGPYGNFANIAKSYSVMLWLSMNRDKVRIMLLLITVLISWWAWFR